MPTILFPTLVPADALVFDNVEDFRVSPQISVTDHPIELGVEVSDHAQKLPVIITFRGRKTTTPLLTPAPAVIELSIAWFERNAGQLVTLSSSRGVWASLMVERYPWGNEGLAEIVFDVALKEVRIATPVSVVIPPRLPAPPLQVGAATAANAGVQPPVPVPPPPPTSFVAALF
jgi:hypothetical protein